MAKIELTVGENYVSDWGLWQAIRELVQNGLDAKADGHEFEHDYNERTQVLRFMTKGAMLEPKTLLLGYSSKRNRPDQLGQYGEGYKLALLALVNAGHPVVIRTGEDKWVPMIEPSDKFGGEKVLVIEVTKKVIKHRNAVEIEIGGIDHTRHEEMLGKLLPFRPARDTILTDRGTILLDPERKGQVYVGGLYVQEIKDLQYGYDFPPANMRLDRDRHMANRWDLEDGTSNAWFEAVAAKPELISKVMELLKTNAEDVRSMGGSYHDKKTVLIDQVAEQFKNSFGEETIPVSSEEEVQEARLYGKKGVVVPKAMVTLLATKLKTLASVKDDPKSAIEAEVTDLTKEERNVYARLVDMVSLLPVPMRAEIIICTFRSEEKKGIHLAAKDDAAQRVYIARRLLDSGKEATEVMIAQLAALGNLREHAAIDQIQLRLWSIVSDEMWNSVERTMRLLHGVEAVQPEAVRAIKKHFELHDAKGEKA